jgi:predicted dehydrogenase
MRALTVFLTSVLCLFTAAVRAADDPKPIRAGIIGLDTSHVVAFTKIFNDPKAAGDVASVKVVAAFPGGSPDIASSRDRVEGYTKTLREEYHVEIVDSIPALLAKVDVVLIESVDGRKHLGQVKPVFEAGKPVYIDKPLAASLPDAVAIVELGRKHNVPWFSASSLRFGKTVQAVKKDDKVGEIRGAVAWSPCPLEATHGDLFWYGIHGVEELYTLMGPGCVSVTRTSTEGADVVTGVWKDGRVGTFRGIRDGKATYGGVVFGAKSTADAGGYGGYEPLVEQIATFFRTKQPPVSPEETLEIMAFMAAADDSKAANGATVKLSDVMAKAAPK